ncbi:DEAD/DEAH box helicase family protein [Bacillus inaquosorum]|uniref:DEAD/DEAH box helicase family protein n=1 Tax=Bacillus inaquosorum TaxID=483913 RepID=UPI00227ED121|nr:DEAD/DEAH box helicase family protein [Bacillus inaquosorum]MCY8723305.1 DEAD/DEAH box helicase family protein [Bacillus inaquosorum]MEC0637463.1 DEAD/DEAH box helicase family protein [Bacillus inaquosorum]
MLDFSKLLEDTLDTAVVNPIEIFDLLPEKNEKYEELLRPAQQRVLETWCNDFRDNPNTVIKMNTGSGKTVVGLLMLQSYLNEGKGPAIYIVPDNYLIEQIIKEANDLGLSVTRDNNASEFLNGESILITNMHKIINGRSVFGVGEVKKSIGCIVVDDAHACMKVAKSQFSITIPRSNDIYEKLLNIFSDSIKQQSESRYLDIKEGDKNTQQLIPFWEWHKNYSRILELLHEKRNDNSEGNKSLFFNWPLLKDNLELAECIITGQEFIINLDFIPIDVIPSFDQCPHRIFMSATIDDDSILVSHFNIDSTQIENCITPGNANDIGERMILIPQELNPKITEDELKRYYKYLSTKVNVVILVPSTYRSRYWNDVADVTVSSQDEMLSTVEKLKKQHVGLVVLINKYDGIDLPKSACEVLVIDGMPDVRSQIEKYEQIALRGSKEVLKDNIQRIEQGMGRGIRSKEDHCVVFLMGNSLVKSLYSNEAKEMFTEATQMQLKLSKSLDKQLKGASLKEIDSAIWNCLSRTPEWVKLSKATILKLKYNPKNSFDEVIIKQREAFNDAGNRDYRGALQKIQELINSASNNNLKGFLKYKYARYENFVNHVTAQQTLMSAKKINSQLLHPVSGIVYQRLQFDNIPQANKIGQFNLHNYQDTNEYLLGFNALIDKLHFEDFSANVFEQAIKELGEHLGFISQRPENDFRKGPDNMWASINNICFVIECKNEATAITINKDYCNQLNGSIVWFEENYPAINTFTPIMIHPNTKFEYAASPDARIRIMNKSKLDLLRGRLREFASQVAITSYDQATVAGLLKVFKLEAELFIDEYTVNFD